MSIQSQSALIAAIIMFALTARMLIQERRPWRFYAFAFLTGVLTAWNLFQFMGELTTWRGWVRMEALASLLVPLGTLSFFRFFLDASQRNTTATPLEPGVLQTQKSWRVLALGAVALTPFVLGLWDRRWVRVAAAVYVFAGMYYCMVPIWRRLQTSSDPIESARLKYLLVGGCASITFALLDLIPRLQSLWPGFANSPVFGSVILVIYMYFLSEILIQERLMGLSELFGKLVVLVPMALVLAVVYVLFSLLSEEPSRWFLFNTTIVMAFVVAILYEPMKLLVEERVGQMIFRERFEFSRQLSLLRREIANAVELDELAELLMMRLAGSRRVTHASLYVLDDSSVTYRLLGSLLDAPDHLDAVQDRVAFQYIRTERTVLWSDLREDLDQNAKDHDPDAHSFEVLEHVLRVLEKTHAGVCLAIVSAERLVGLLFINDERLRNPYTPEEIRSFSQIAAQIAISIENSKAVSALREKDRLAAVGQMAAGLAHEIRNPLGAIKGAVQVLSLYVPESPAEPDDDDDDEPPEAFLEIILEETDRLNRVVSQFLDYARPWRGDPAPCDINPVVEKVAALFRQQASDWRVALSFEPGGSLPEAHADPEQLRQVLLNLVINAIHATGEEPPESDGLQGSDLSVEAGSERRGRVVLRTSKTRRVHEVSGRFMTRDMVCVSIEDNGPGIPSEEHASIFVPFFTTKQKGTGLGLAISQRIVENLGGKIELESEEGKGTTFRVLLPLWDSTTRSLSDITGEVPRKKVEREAET